MRRDVRRRFSVAEWFPLRSNLVHIRRNDLLPKELKEEAWKDINAFPIPFTSITHVNNRFETRN